RYNDVIMFYPGIASDSRAKVVEITNESETTGIDITLPGLKRIRVQKGEVTVRIVTEDGTKLPNVSVNLRPAAENGDIFWDRGSSEGRTEEDGCFKFTEYGSKAESNFYLVYVYDTKGYVLKPIPGSNGLKHVYRRVGNVITIPMIKGGVITGKVTNAKGEPVIGAFVSVGDANGKAVSVVPKLARAACKG